MISMHLIRKPKDKEPILYPDDNLCYIVGSNGVFKRVNNDFYEVITKLEGHPQGAPITADVKLKVRKLPYRFVAEAAAFFAAVYRKFQSEAIVVLYNHPEYGWHMDAPPQEVTTQGLHVDYDMSKMPTEVQAYAACRMGTRVNKGVEEVVQLDERIIRDPKDKQADEELVEFKYRLFGTIHSHASTGAFHSGTDDKDEAGFDGLHITIGNVDVPSHSYSARWVLAGKYYKCTMQDAVEDPPQGFFDERWLQRVTKKTYTSTAGTAGGFHSGASSTPYHSSYRNNGYYSDDYYHKGDDWQKQQAGNYHGQDSSKADQGGVAQQGESFRNPTPSTQGNGSQGKGGGVGGSQAHTQDRSRWERVLPESLAKDKPQGETRLQIATLFIELDKDEERRLFFDRLEKKWRDFLIEDLVMYWPIRGANFLKGMGVDLPALIARSSDVSSKNDATGSIQPSSNSATHPQSSCHSDNKPSDQSNSLVSPPPHHYPMTPSESSREAEEKNKQIQQQQQQAQARNASVGSTPGTTNPTPTQSGGYYPDDFYGD